MSRKPRVVLIVDHPLRDLGGLSLVAGELARLGAEVILAPMAFQAEDCFALEPDLVAVNYIRSNNAGFIQKLCDAQIKVALLDTEGGFYGDLNKYTKVLYRESGILDQIDSFFAWGHKMDWYWKNEMRIPEHKVKLTGVARFDFYHPQHQSLIPDQVVAQALGASGAGAGTATGILSSGLIMFNTKVALANPQFQSIEKEKALYLKLGFSEAEIADLLRGGLAFIEEFSNLVKESSRLELGAQIVLRPHPHERIATYQELLAGHKNVLVSRHGDILGWFKNSRALVHRHCTTAIEAALMGVAPISPQWIPTSSNVPDGEAVSYRPKTREEFFEILGQLQKGRLPLVDGAQAVLDQTIHDWLYQVDGQSYKRVAQAIMNSVSGKRMVNIDKCKRYAASQFESRSGVVGASLHGLSRFNFTRKAIRDLRVSRWKKVAKSFAVKDIEPFLGADTRATPLEGMMSGSVLIESSSSKQKKVSTLESMQ